MPLFIIRLYIIIVDYKEKENLKIRKSWSSLAPKFKLAKFSRDYLSGVWRLKNRYRTFIERHIHETRYSERERKRERERAYHELVAK